MENQQADTAILLFAHTAEQEVLHKTFSEQHGLGINKRIANTLLQYTGEVARQSGLPLVAILSDRQQGNTFGERLANAFQEVFSAGYQRVICIGSDCPDLRAEDLLLAQQELRRTHMVIGPARDGGAYLIGLHIDSFDPEAFAILNWQTDEVLHELMLYSYRKKLCMGCVAVLAEKGDVDDCRDLTRQLEELAPSHALRKMLMAILLAGNALHYTSCVDILGASDRLEDSLVLRAPPVL